MVTGCCTLILLQLWSSQSATAIFPCSAILLVYLFQQTWSFIPFFLCFHTDTCCKMFCKSRTCRPFLPVTRCCVSLSAEAVLGLLLLLCCVCSSTCCCSTWSPPLWLFREKATRLHFQHPLCVSTQKLKFCSKPWNVCMAGSREWLAPEQPSPGQQGHRSCMKCTCQSVMDFLINAFTSDRTRVFVIFVTV